MPEECGRSGREGMALLGGGGLEVRAVAVVEIDVCEKVDALELARVGIFCGRGRW